MRWSTGTVVRKSISVSSPLHATLAKFPGLDTAQEDSYLCQPSLCVASKQSVQICSANGRLSESPLPAGVHCAGNRPRLYGTPFGLLLSQAGALRAQTAHYALFHPLDGFREVVGVEDGQECVFCSHDLPVAVFQSPTEWVVYSVGRAESQAIGAEEDHLTQKNSGFGNEKVDHAGAVMGDNIPTEPRPDDPHGRYILQMKPIQRGPVSSTSTMSCCVAHDEAGELVLCICTGSGLAMYSIRLGEDDTVDMQCTFNCPGTVSICSILSTRRDEQACDILALQGDGNLELYAGSMFMASLGPVFGKRGLPLVVASVGEGVGDRFTLTFQDGSQARFSASSLAPITPIVQRVLSTIECACSGLPGSGNPGLLLRRALLSSREKQMLAESDLEWTSMVRMLLGMCASPASPGVDGSDLQNQSASHPKEASPTPWTRILQAQSYGQRYGHLRLLPGAANRGMDIPISIRDVSSSVELPRMERTIACKAFEALHLLYEDLKLNTSRSAWADAVGACNLSLAAHLGLRDAADHYMRDGVRLVEPYVHESRSTAHLQVFQGRAIPDIFAWLCSLLQSMRQEKGPPAQNEAFPVVEPCPPRFSQSSEFGVSWRRHHPMNLTKNVLAYYGILFKPMQSDIDKDRVALLVERMAADGFGEFDLGLLPPGIALPIREALWHFRDAPLHSVACETGIMLGREDLWPTRIEDAPESQDRTTAASHGLYSDNALKNAESEEAQVKASRALLQIHAASASHEDEMVRVRSSLISNPFPAGGEDHAGTSGGGEQGDVASELPSHARRRNNEPATSSLEIGVSDGCEIDGAVFQYRFGEDRRISEVRRLLRSTDPVVVRMTGRSAGADDLAETERSSALQQKAHVLLQRNLAVPVGRGAFTLRTLTPSDPSMSLPIPGICLTGKVAGQKGTRVSFNAETSPYPPDWGQFHNGVAAGLRLIASSQGAISTSGTDASSNLTRTWIVNHKPSGAAGDPSHAGMLFALGLGGYLPALRATDYYEYLVPMHDLTSIGLMLGVAAGNRGSFHGKITKMLCVHIRHFNAPGFAVPDFHVSTSVQTAAVLGIGLLYQGTCEQLIVEGLLAEMYRRPSPGDIVDDREALSLGAGFALGITCLGVADSRPALSQIGLLDALCLYANGGVDRASQRSANEARNGVADGHITSKVGGAGTNQQHTSSAESETSRVRETAGINMDVTAPGALIALGLVYLRSNAAGVADRIPLPNTSYMLDRCRPDHVFLRSLARHLIMWDSIEADKDWLLRSLPELLRPPVHSEPHRGIDLHRVWPGNKGPADVDLDESGVLIARAFAIAGSCTAIALRYAGSSDSAAMSVLFNVCLSFEQCVRKQPEDEEEIEWAYSTCLSSVALGLCVVAAGSGNLSIFRLLRRLRKRSGPSMKKKRYGFHMAIHMALGFLFLGGGCLTFGTSDIAVASLLCAIYPRFPTEVDDNQYHLQAMRHLYVLAVEPRCVEALDVDTNLPCYVPLRVNLRRDGKRQPKTMLLAAPALLPDAREIESISVVCERYLPKEFKVPAVSKGGWFSPTERLRVYVKRRPGHLPLSLDPTGSKGMLARSLGQARLGSDSMEGIAQLVRAFTADPNMVSFVRNFCNPGAQAESSSAWLSRTLYECLSADKPEAIKYYFEVDLLCRWICADKARVTDATNLAFLGEYSIAEVPWAGCLVRRELLSHCCDRARAHVRQVGFERCLREYVRGRGRWPIETSPRDGPVVLRHQARVLGLGLRLNRIPPVREIYALATLEGETSPERAWLQLNQCLTATTPTCAVESLTSALLAES